MRHRYKHSWKRFYECVFLPRFNKFHDAHVRVSVLPTAGLQLYWGSKVISGLMALLFEKRGREGKVPLASAMKRKGYGTSNHEKHVAYKSSDEIIGV